MLAIVASRGRDSLTPRIRTELLEFSRPLPGLQNYFLMIEFPPFPTNRF